MDFATPRLSIAFYMHSVPFTKAVLNHETSLGGSESACRVLMEALATRGHDVHCFATQLEEAGEYFGVQWHKDEHLPEVLKFAPPDVFVSLRMPHVFAVPNPAKLRIFWTQDLLIDDAFMGQLYPIDRTMFVSQYHREQWCNLQPVLRPGAWVTKNPIDPADLVHAFGPEGSEMPAKVSHRLIHVSRPERGLDGVMALWPEIRKRWPDATIAVCRYSSMYDAAGWGKVCESYDRRLEKLNAEHGGIEFLGELNKPALYRELAKAVALLYPTTQPGFAETNCVAVTEAQACGTPVIATRRGALPETLHPHAGKLIDGEVLEDEHTRDRFYAAVAEMFEAHDSGSGAYGAWQEAGQRHAMEAYGPAVAEAWERQILSFFRERYEANKVKVLRQLLHWDQHAHAKLVARDILIDGEQAGRTLEGGLIDDMPPLEREAFDADQLCDRVIRQEEQTAEHYAKYAIQDPTEEARNNGRLHLAGNRLKQHLAQLQKDGALVDHEGKPRPARILDVSCGNGSMVLHLAETCPEDTILHGIDYSQGVIDLARKASADYGRRVRFWTVEDASADLPNVLTRKGEGEPYDLVFCGEFIEHVEKPWQLLDELETVCAPHGLIVLTTPCGPFAELLQRGIPRQRGHVHAFSVRDLARMCEHKRNYGWSYLDIGRSPRGNACGYWLFSYSPGGGAAQPIDYASTILTERPYQRIHVAMIVKDSAEWLRKCLDSLYGVVDQVTIYDTGSTDGSIELARELGAEVIEGDWPNDFSIARNRSLDAAEPGAEWIFWIDADEHLVNGERLRFYATDASMFNGFVVRQHHLCVDQPPFDDKPVRLFRAQRGVRFYGVVHEQPEDAIDKGITPALDQQDVKVIHFGYESEWTRRTKMKDRNLPLLMREIKGQATHQTRQLAWCLYMRDCCSLALWEMERAGGKRTPGAMVLAERACGVYFAQKFDDPTSMQHPIAWPFYQEAMRILGKRGVEVAWTFAAAPGRLDLTKVRPKVETWKASTLDEVQRMVQHNVTQWTKRLDPPVVDVEPYFPTPVFKGVPADQVRAIIREAAPHSWGDNRRVTEWAALFLEAIAAAPEGSLIGSILEVGTWKGASAFVWLKLLEALKRPVPVITIDPYGGKPYNAGNNDEEPLYGDPDFVAMKQLLAKFPNHYHFPVESERFLSPLFPKRALVWREGKAIDLDYFQFVLLDGEHAADTIDFELANLLGKRSFDGHGLVAPGGVVVIDNVDTDLSTIEMLADRYGAGVEFYPAKWNQVYAVIRVPVQTSAREAA